MQTIVLLYLNVIFWQKKVKKLALLESLILQLLVNHTMYGESC